MKIFFKMALIIATLVVLALGAIVAVLLTVDPNAYKPQITAAVKDATGREMSINGDIAVSIYPVLGFKVAGLALGNPEGFSEKDFVKAGAVQAGVKIMPLLEKKVELTTIRLDAPEITVIKLANGKTNLEFPRKEKKEPAVKAQGFDISFKGLAVSKARVTVIDKAAGKTTVINPLNLEVLGEYSSVDTPVSLDFTLNNPAPAKPLKIDAKAMLKADLDAGQVTARALRVRADMGLGEPIEVTGDLVADLKSQKVTIDNFSAGWQGTSFKGQAGLEGFSPPKITFDLQADRVDLDALKPKQAVKPDPQKALLPVDALRTLNMQGAVKIKTVKTAGLDLSNLNATIKAAGGQLTVSPVAFGLYGGQVDSAVRINTASGTPDFSLQGNLKGMKVGDFLIAKAGQDFVTGLAQVSFDLGGRGNSMSALQKAARGQIDFAFSDGYINKWQLSRLLNQAIAYFETGKMPTSVPDTIYFTSLKGVFNGQDGVFRNDNLQLIGPKSHALGSGAINLGAQSVDYVIKAGLGDKVEDFAKAKRIPVRIQGPLAKPSYNLDMQALIQDVAGEKIEEKKQEALDKLFKKLDEKTAPKKKDPVVGTVTTTEPVAEVPAVVTTPAAEKDSTPVAAPEAPAVQAPAPVVEAAPEVVPEAASEAVPEAAGAPVPEPVAGPVVEPAAEAVAPVPAEEVLPESGGQ